MLNSQADQDQQDPLLSVGSTSRFSFDENNEFCERNRPQKKLRLLSISFIAILCLSLGFTCGILLKLPRFSSPAHITTAENRAQCRNAPVRREWRSLSRTEKESYIDSVQCLRETPSMLRLNQTLYDDFPWVHSRVGELCTLVFTLSRPFYYYIG